MPVIIGARITAERPLHPNPREIHYLACTLFEAGDSQACHTGQDKPFSIWPLRPAPGPRGLNWTVRAAWLRADPPPADITSLDKLWVGHTACTVTETMHRSAAHAQLAGGPVLASVKVTFASPTYFSHNAATLLTPDPRRIAESWRRSWNAWLPDPSDLAIADATWQEISKTIELAAFELRTTTISSGHGRDQAGFTGSATLRLGKRATDTAQSAFSTLARFAEFCGTGAQTTHGFGATRPAAQEW